MWPRWKSLGKGFGKLYQRVSLILCPYSCFSFYLCSRCVLLLCFTWFWFCNEASVHYIYIYSPKYVPWSNENLYSLIETWWICLIKSGRHVFWKKCFRWFATRAFLQFTQKSYDFINNNEIVNKNGRLSFLGKTNSVVCNKDLKVRRGPKSNFFMKMLCFGLKVFFSGNFIMVLHGFASRSPKLNVFVTPKPQNKTNNLNNQTFWSGGLYEYLID